MRSWRGDPAIAAAGIPVPQIMHLFAFKPTRTEHLARVTPDVMRGPSPLLPGERELIAALTSTLNQCRRRGYVAGNVAAA